MKTIAALFGILSGLSIAYTHVQQPARRPFVAPQRNVSFAQGLPPNLPGLPPNPIVGPTLNDGATALVDFEGKQYRVSPHANDIPYLMIGGRTLSINGGQSAPTGK